MLSRQPTLKELNQEYGRLWRLEGRSPQSRGQRLNGLIADLLRCWEINAAENVHGSGEIDVAFTLDDTRFILEAKWEREPINIDPIAKLQKRVRQRLAGTRGIFLSMSGYTAPALNEVKEGERLEVLLLDAQHFEAALSGLVPPQELFLALLDRASFRGDAYSSLRDLVVKRSDGPLDIVFGPPVGGELAQLVRQPSEFDAEVVLSNLPFGHCGVGVAETESRLLVTLTPGIIEADLDAARAEVRVPIPECSRNPLCDENGSVYFTRRAGIGRWHGGELSVVGGGLAANQMLLMDPERHVWAFSNETPAEPPGSPFLIRLGESLRDQQWHELPSAEGHWRNAAWVDHQRLLLIAAGEARIVSLDGQTTSLPANILNPQGLMRHESGVFISASDEVWLTMINPDAGTVRPLAQLGLQGSISELAPTADGGYLYSHYSDRTRQTKGTIVRFRIAGSS
jgi:hypothetical protein